MQVICRTAAKSCVHASYVHSNHSIHSVILQAQVSSAESRSGNKQVHKVSPSVLQHSLRG